MDMFIYLFTHFGIYGCRCHFLFSLVWDFFRAQVAVFMFIYLFFWDAFIYLAAVYI